MNLEDERRLKFDRRLRNRRGWVTDDEARAHEESLPDASHKISSGEDQPETKPEAGEQPPVG